VKIKVKMQVENLKTRETEGKIDPITEYHREWELVFLC
jgi:hypothetical protein